jgi:hypothetical protein
MAQAAAATVSNPIAMQVATQVATQDYANLARDMLYQRSRPEEEKDFCMSIVDVEEIIAEVLHAADVNAGVAEKRPLTHNIDYDEDGKPVHVYHQSISVKRTITSGVPQASLQELIDRLGAEFTPEDTRKTSIKSKRSFKGTWLNQLEEARRFVFNYPDGPRETIGMKLDAHELNIPVLVSPIGTKFSLPFEHGMRATFYFPNKEYAHLPLPTIKAIFDAQVQEHQILRGQYSQRHRELYEIEYSMDTEIRKIDPTYYSWYGKPYAVEGYVPPNEAIRALYEKYTALASLIGQNPPPTEYHLGELLMPEFIIMCSTDILSSPEFKASPLYQLFLGGDSKVINFIGELIRLSNLTTVTLDRFGGFAFSETDFECVDRGCSDEPPKNFVDVNVNSRYWVEIENEDHYTGEVVNHFTCKVVSPVPPVHHAV